MKVLVTAATKYGATRSPRRSVMPARPRLDPTVIPPGQVDRLDGYDAVVLGSAVYAGTG